MVTHLSTNRARCRATSLMRPTTLLMLLFIIYYLLLLLFIIIFLPRYSVPEDLEITNKEKKNYNGCNGLAGSERVLK